MNATATADPATENDDNGAAPYDERAALQKQIEAEEAEATFQAQRGRNDLAQKHSEEAEKRRQRLAELPNDTPSAESQEEPQSSAAEPDADEIVVAGVQMTFPSMGGKRPTTATLNFTGGKVKLLEGTALKKGTRFSFHGEAVVNHVAQKDVHDAETQQVTSAEQNHKARVTALAIEVPE